MSVAVNYYAGLKRGGDANPFLVTNGTAPVGSTIVADAATADTAAATGVTDAASAVTKMDLVASTAVNGLVAIMAGSVAYTAHQLTGTPAASPSITQAQLTALITLFNTMATAVLLAQTDNTATKAATAAVKVDAAAGFTNDVELRMQIDNGTAKTGLTRKDVAMALCAIEDYVHSGGINHAGTNIPPAQEGT